MSPPVCLSVESRLWIYVDEWLVESIFASLGGTSQC